MQSEIDEQLDLDVEAEEHVVDRRQQLHTVRIRPGSLPPSDAPVAKPQQQRWNTPLCVILALQLLVIMLELAEVYLLSSVSRPSPSVCTNNSTV